MGGCRARPSTLYPGGRPRTPAPSDTPHPNKASLCPRRLLLTEALLPQEILEEVVRELHKVKEEIIDAIRQELSGISTS